MHRDVIYRGAMHRDVMYRDVTRGMAGAVTPAKGGEGRSERGGGGGRRGGGGGEWGG